MNAIERIRTAQDVPDYHPHSDNKVRDLVHQALYAYVAGESALLWLTAWRITPACASEYDRLKRGDLFGGRKSRRCQGIGRSCRVMWTEGEDFIALGGGKNRFFFAFCRYTVCASLLL
eukprot:scaffold4700_cov271-Pinguiococcus_pyrenoidosus.AAC.9